MRNSVYSINEGINKSIEFKGLKAQYIWYFGGGVIALLILFAEFNLHNDYFNSLKSINPVVKNYGRVADIIGLQLMITNTFKSASRRAGKSKAFAGDELKYFNQVFSGIINDCTDTIDELIALITSNKLEMKDDERLKRIDDLYSNIKGIYTFAQSFAVEANTLATSRLKEVNEIQGSRILNGIKKK